MSLDVSLMMPESVATEVRAVHFDRIFIREDGQTKELTHSEWDERFPDKDPFTTDDDSNSVFSANITHNLGKMADVAGIYMCTWRPEEIGITTARQLIPLLERGLDLLEAQPDHFKQFNASNGWGTYDQFVPWIAKYLEACRKYPEAIIEVSR